MNYYMPYFNMSPSTITPMVGRGVSRGLFSRLLGGLNWSSILSNTQKTLGIVNQAIPMVKQITPVMKNAKTMFKVMNEFKRIDTSTPTSNVIEKNNETNETIEKIEQNNVTTTNDGGPTFFIN